MKKALLLNSIIKAIVTITTSFGIDGHRADINDDEGRQGERSKTIKTLADIHQNTLVWYDRRKDMMSITGSPGDTDAIFDLADRLKIPPEYLLTH